MIFDKEILPFDLISQISIFQSFDLNLQCVVWYWPNATVESKTLAK